jgi:hypothetical protein
MRAIPTLAPEIDDIVAFLAAAMASAQGAQRMCRHDLDALRRG